MSQEKKARAEIITLAACCLRRLTKWSIISLFIMLNFMSTAWKATLARYDVSLTIHMRVWFMS